MLDAGRAAPPGRMPWSAGEGHGPPANPELPQGGPIWNRPLQGLRRGGEMRFPGCPPAQPSAVGADSISARVTLRRRGVARDDVSIVPYRGCNNAGFEISRVAANPPLAVGADSISARGTLRRRGFSGAVAAFSQICRAGVHARRTTAFQNGNVRAVPGYRGCNNAGFEISRAAASPPLDVGEGFIPPAGVRTAAGSGGMRASRPTAAGGGGDGNPFGRNVCHGS